MKQRDDWHLTDQVVHESGRADPFAAAVRATRMPMIITDPRREDNPIVFANKAFQELTGYTREEVIGRNCRFLQGPGTDEENVRQLREAVAKEEDIRITLLNYKKCGQAFWNELYINPVPQESGEVQFFFASQVDVTERVQAQRQIGEKHALVEKEVKRRTKDLQQALEQKTTLLNELDHRVKNNLTSIEALIRLQQRTIEDPESAEILGRLKDRIGTMSAVHRQLYDTGGVAEFECGRFAASLAEDLLQSSGLSGVKLQTDFDEVQLPPRKASSFGLIMNELLTNALKYGFPDGSGSLMLKVCRKGDEAIVLVADDGPGFDRNVPRSGSLGMGLVERLAREIAAETVWRTSSEGTEVRLSIPLKIKVLRPLNILLVEDEALIAMDLEAMVEAAGHRLFAEAGSFDEVMLISGLDQVDVAFVDIRLKGTRTGIDVSLWLRERYKDLVIIFLSANTKQIPETLASHHGSIPKPIRESGFVQTLQYLLEVLRAPPPKATLPSCLTARPLLQQHLAA